ncbi:hypothetical protein JOC62_003588 [Clostridium sardiniense]|nr:hypothetical protein [Clostridium sardiniense]
MKKQSKILTVKFEKVDSKELASQSIIASKSHGH